MNLVNILSYFQNLEVLTFRAMFMFLPPLLFVSLICQSYTEPKMIEINDSIYESDRQSGTNLNITQIERISSQNLSYDMFHEKFMCHNLPILIRSISQNWNATKTWIKSNESNISSIDFDYLKSRIPNCKVPIAECTKHVNAHEKFEMNFHDFLDYWMKQMNGESCEDKLWYLKDWHLRKFLPTYDFYDTPQYFGSDWLNEYCGVDRDDYKFVYMGPKGTWTPLHSDVFSSFSWSTNIFGTKKWIILCPNEEQKLMDNLMHLPVSITEDVLQERNCKYFCLIQSAGETLFVPTGWYHQVHNLEHTISINHNFFNGCNVSNVWSALYESYRKVLKEIDDCKDMDNFEEHCQVMLKALHGMSFEDFLNLLEIIVINRIKCLQSRNQLSITEFVLGRNLCIFDLRAVQTVLCEIEVSIESQQYLKFQLHDLCNRLRTQIDDVLKQQIE